MKGYYGKYLDVNLSEETIKEYEIPDDWMEKYLGGRGIGARILLEELEKGVNPLSPKSFYEEKPIHHNT